MVKSLHTTSDTSVVSEVFTTVVQKKENCLTRKQGEEAYVKGG